MVVVISNSVVQVKSEKPKTVTLYTTEDLLEANGYTSEESDDDSERGGRENAIRNLVAFAAKHRLHTQHAPQATSVEPLPVREGPESLPSSA
jgi:hypothetical protein